MRLLCELAVAFTVLFGRPELVRAEVMVRPREFCGLEYAKIGNAMASPLSMNEAQRLAFNAWNTTARYMRRFRISDTVENRARIISTYERALSHELTPLGPLRMFREANGLRAVDAPQLEVLKEQGVPEYIIKHLTVDHHNSFGAGLPANVNSTTQILDMLDSSNAAFVQPQQFSRNFRNFASDNIGDAFGLARAVARNANAIRANPQLRETLRELAVAEDFGVFGPDLNLAAGDQLSALLRLNDRTLQSIGVDRAGMDRIALGFSAKTKQAIESSSDDYDRVLFPKTKADLLFARSLAEQFRRGVRDGIAQTEKLQRPVVSSTGQAAPIFFADVTSLPTAAQGEFEKWVTIPQMIRQRELRGGPVVERKFTISGDSSAATRMVIMANFPQRGRSMVAPVEGQTQSFVDALVEAEAKSIERHLGRLSTMGADALKPAQDRLRQIHDGTWRPQMRPDGTLVFGATYMTADEFHDFVRANLALLGY